MTDNQNQQEHLKAFEAYFPSHDRAGNVIKEIKKDLAELNQITDIEKQYQKAGFVLSKHIYNESITDSHWNDGNLWELESISWKETLGEHKRLINQAREISSEALKKINSTTCAYCQTKNLTNPYVWTNNSGFKTVFCNEHCLDEYLAPCDECKNSRYGNNWQRTDQTDGKRFCSKKCFDKHYKGQDNNNNTQEQRSTKRERESNPTKEQHLPSQYCPRCQKSITSDIIWVEDEAKDDLEFCSANCCTTYYQVNPYCNNCGRVNAPQWFTWKEVNENNKFLNDTKFLVEYLETELNKKIHKDYAKKYCLPDCLWKDSSISQALEGWTHKEWENLGHWRNKKNKRESKKDDHSHSFTPHQLNNSNQANTSQGNANPPQEQPSQSKVNVLLVYTLCGLAGIGLISLIVWLVIKAKGNK